MSRRAPGGASPSGPVARLTPKGARRRRAGHPWIYQSDIAAPPAAEPGDIVDVVEPGGRPLGRAAWSARSQIALRAVPLAPDEDPDAGWLRLLDEAITRRDDRPPATRLVNGDADGLPGLVIDRFGPAASIQALTPAAWRRLDATVARLRDRGAATIALRNDSRVAEFEGLPADKRLLVGDDPRVLAPVGRLQWAFDLLAGQKTGGFLDQLENHQATATFARGECLDVFTYEGGFALQMAAAGRPVLAVDSSAPAIERLREHAARNTLTVTAEVHNAFDALRAWERDGRRFDTIVLDPPPFARARHAVEAATRAYKEINLRAFKLLRPGGRLVTCSCSAHVTRPAFEQIIADAAADAGVWARVVERRGAPPDHPTLLTAPETDYLKVLFVSV
ncbi:MAG: class I SAM-dependent rRNA methyltransferase [Myxococcales bacterium]|nr:class I SAM-dependent rRNA methyltransferase [Myxococcales bacterium]MCB9553813.1 class I SAM-dependent rRNA methyltransferase [Myxococcales bacterium]